MQNGHRKLLMEGSFTVLMSCRYTCLLSFLQHFSSEPNLQCWKYFCLKVNSLKIGKDEKKINNDYIAKYNSSKLLVQHL